MKSILFHFVLSIVLADLVLEYGLDMRGNAAVSLGVWTGCYAALWLLSFLYNKKHFQRVPRLVSLVLFFLKELVVANLRVAYEVITPPLYMKPGVIALPLDARTDLEITLLANMISLTPGTLSLEVAEDRSYLYVHAIHVEPEATEALKQSIKEGFERRILAITR